MLDGEGEKGLVAHDVAWKDEEVEEEEVSGGLKAKLAQHDIVSMKQLSVSKQLTACLYSHAAVILYLTKTQVSNIFRKH